MGQQITVTVVFIFNFHHGINPFFSAISCFVVIKANISNYGNDADGKKANQCDNDDFVSSSFVFTNSPRLHVVVVDGALFQLLGG